MEGQRTKNRPLSSIQMSKSSSVPSKLTKGDQPLQADALINNDVDLKHLHNKLETNAAQVFFESEMNQKTFANESNRLLSSHLSVFQTLENSELNNVSESLDKTKPNTTDWDKTKVGAREHAFRANEEPGAFSLTSWQSISSVKACTTNDPNQQLSGADTNSHGPSVNSILSLSSDNDEPPVHQNNLPHGSPQYTTMSHNPTKLSKLLSHRAVDQDSDHLDKEFDSDDSGTFEIDMNALINMEADSGSKARTSSNALSPSFIMPRMIVASQSSKLQTKHIRICVVGNGLNKIQKHLNEYSKLHSDCSFQYVFTNLNSKVDLVILVFDSSNGLYTKDLFNILSSYKKQVLPVIYQSPIRLRRKSKIVSGGISDGSDNGDDDYIPKRLYQADKSSRALFDINESMLVTLLMNNGIKIFNSPIRLNDDETLTFENLHHIIISYFTAKFETPFEDEDEDEDVEHVQSSTSTWASTIIQNRNIAESDNSRRNSSSRMSFSKNKKRRMSNSHSSHLDKTRRKRIDKKRLSSSKINNSDPLNLGDKRKFIFNAFLSLGVSLSIVTAITLVTWYKKTGSLWGSKPLLGNSLAKNSSVRKLASNTSKEYKVLLRQAKDHLNVSSSSPSSSYANYIDIDTVVASAKRVIYNTRILILRSFSMMKDIWDSLPNYTLLA